MKRIIMLFTATTTKQNSSISSAKEYAQALNTIMKSIPNLDEIQVLMIEEINLRYAIKEYEARELSDKMQKVRLLKSYSILKEKEFRIVFTSEQFDYYNSLLDKGAH